MKILSPKIYAIKRDKVTPTPYVRVTNMVGNVRSRCVRVAVRKLVLAYAYAPPLFLFLPLKTVIDGVFSTVNVIPNIGTSTKPIACKSLDSLGKSFFILALDITADVSSGIALSSLSFPVSLEFVAKKSPLKSVCCPARSFGITVIAILECFVEKVWGNIVGSVVIVFARSNPSCGKLQSYYVGHVYVR